MKKFTVILIGLVKSKVLHATMYYVAKNSNDNDPGTSDLQWFTIQKAAYTVSAGDTVYVRRGKYSEKVKITQSGRAVNNITFSAYPGESATIYA
jgi:hypothetical protein